MSALVLKILQNLKNNIVSSYIKGALKTNIRAPDVPPYPYMLTHNHAELTSLSHKIIVYVMI